MARPVKTALALALAIPAALTVAVASPALAASTTVSPGQSIQAAIDAASPGDTITVAPGTYTENLEITTNDITLQGAGPGSTILKPPANPTHNDCYRQGVFPGVCILGQTDAQHNVTTPVTGVTVSGFRVQGFPGDGIYALGANDLTITNDRLVNNGGNGVAVYVGSLNNISNDTATGSGGAGFLIADSPNAATKLDNDVARNNAVGVYIRDSFAFVFSPIAGSEVNFGTFTGNCVGILFLDTPANPDTADWNAYGNQVIANNKYCPSLEGFPVALSGTGIAIIGGNAISVRGNNVRDNVPSVNKLPYSGGIVLAAYPGAPGKAIQSGDFSYNTAFGNKPYDIRYDGSGPKINRPSGFFQILAFVFNNCDTSQPKLVYYYQINGFAPLCDPTPVTQIPGYPGF